MPDPVPYEREYSFSAWQAANPTKTLPASSLDNELMNIEAALNGAVEYIVTRARSLSLTSDSIDGFGQFDANGNRVAGLADGVEQDDAATVRQVQDVGGSAGAAAGASAGAAAASDVVANKSDVDLSNTVIADIVASPFVEKVYDERSMMEAFTNKDKRAGIRGYTSDEDLTPEMMGFLADMSAKKVSTLLPAGLFLVNGDTGPLESYDQNVRGGLPLNNGFFKLKGSGRGRTIIRNKVDNWRSVISSRGCDYFELAHLTIDGDWPNRTPVTLGAPGPTTDSIRGEGIIFWAGLQTLRKAHLYDLEIINTGHYGMGLQNCSIEEFLGEGLWFENIGGDAIDTKPGVDGTWPKDGLIFDGVFIDGHGRNPDAPDNQAGLDIRGYTHASNIYVREMERNASHTQIQGIRFNSRIDGEGGRGGAKRSTLTSFGVTSKRTPGVGNISTDKTVGLMIAESDVSATNGTIDNCLFGVAVSVTEGTDPNVERVNLSNINVLRARGTAGVGRGYDIGSTARYSNFLALTATDCDWGADWRGSHNAVFGYKATNCDLGFNTTEAVAANNTFVGFNFASNTLDLPAGLTLPDGGSFNDGIQIVRDRRGQLRFISTANDSNWLSGDARILHEILFESRDTTGAAAGIRGALRARMSGNTGGATNMELTASGTKADGTVALDVLVATFATNLASFSTPILPVAVPKADLVGGALKYAPASYAGSIVMVSNATPVNAPAYSNGTAWLYVRDDAAVV